MKSLLEFYNNHSGKVSLKWELYLTEYDRLLKHYREEKISLLEIGIQNGGSLEIWSQYFPYAHALVGCDINPNCGNLSFDDPRIAVVVGDATKAEVMARILNHATNFDLIIEDGSHISSDIITAFALYFPTLKPGGIFIAEDLHCSYWGEYEGGIYHPYSSISFFKHLADMINHEHWGVEKKRLELINGFKELRNIKISESILAEISSVEFFNSVCVVKKSHRNSNCLGGLIVAGLSEQIVSGHLPLLGKKSTALNQSSNEWSIIPTSPAELYQKLCTDLRDKQDSIDHLNNEMAIILNSRSWRYTFTLRKIGSLARQVFYICRKVKNKAQLSGGYTCLAVKVLRIIYKEGLRGVLIRLSNVKHTSLIIKHFNNAVNRDDGQK